MMTVGFDPRPVMGSVYLGTVVSCLSSDLTSDLRHAALSTYSVGKKIVH